MDWAGGRGWGVSVGDWARVAGPEASRDQQADRQQNEAGIQVATWDGHAPHCSGGCLPALFGEKQIEPPKRQERQGKTGEDQVLGFLFVFLGVLCVLAVQQVLF
jgi:hypothetical protein